MADWDDDEPIGYGRPPKWSRFKKGQSGNYNGRRGNKGARKKPKKAEPAGLAIDKVLLDLVKQKVRVSENGQMLNIPALEALVKAHLSMALGKNQAALRDLTRNVIDAMMREVHRAEHEQELLKARKVDEEERQRQLFAYYVRLKGERTATWEAATKAGRDEPDFPWPHPDDILLDHAKQRFRIRGPLRGEEVPNYLWHRALRDLFLAKMVLQTIESKGPSEAMAEFFNRLWVVQDYLLPRRWQIVGDTDGREMAQLFTLPIGRLRQLVTEREETASSWERRLCKPSARKDGYRFANELLCPVLRANGYRSLKQFETAYVDTMSNPPWPLREENMS